VRRHHRGRHGTVKFTDSRLKNGLRLIVAEDHASEI
jgi:hypothetical protein